jgi:hypothetical protein
MGDIRWEKGMFTSSMLRLFSMLKMSLLMRKKGKFTRFLLRLISTVLI